MVTMTAELDDGTEIENVHEVVEGSNGVHLKKDTGSGGIQRVAYVPYPTLRYVYHDG